jgi:hypothetical protein
MYRIDYSNKLRKKSASGWSSLIWRRKKKWKRRRSQQWEEEVKWPVSMQHTHVIQEPTGPRKFQRKFSTLPRIPQQATKFYTDKCACTCTQTAVSYLYPNQTQELLAYLLILQ